MAKPYFTFYRSYYDASKNLKDSLFVEFNRTLCKVHFSDKNTLQHAKSIKFNNNQLKKAWEIVLRQLAKRDRNCKEYTDWRNDVYKRDCYTCQICTSKKKINAHHIVRWVDSIELRFELSNGITLCEECHRQVHRGEIEL